MEWTPDDEDIPITIPSSLRAFEKLGDDRLNAMTRQELEDRLLEASEAAAANYRKQVPNSNYDNCVLTVSTVLQKVGSDIGTPIGAIMTAESLTWAQKGCASVFHIDQDS